MRIDDLTPYDYDGDAAPDRLAVGWLDPAVPFDRGEVGPKIVHDRFVAVLQWAAVNRSVDAYRGRHDCELGDCGLSGNEWPDPPVARFADQEASLGNAQIEVEDADGIRYVAPNLIVHYVEAHQYRPPDEFVRAALVGEWRSPERVPGGFRFVGPGIAIDDWSPELAAILWDELAANLGTAPGDVRHLVEVEVRPAEVTCLYTQAGLPSVAVWITPAAANWGKSKQWLPTAAGTRQLAAWTAEEITRARR